MAQPLVWPGQYFFYPIGNTSALYLTRDISFEGPANILLLGCGDPRNVLYTIFFEADSDRKLDFTCCDYDPAILARNVLLFSMIVDNDLDAKILWNIFFHIHIDKSSLSALTEQCEKLISASDNLHTWEASPYGYLMKMCTEYTLNELRRHWRLYTEMHSLPSKRLEKIRSAFTALFNSQRGLLPIVTRSAGPLFLSAVEATQLQFIAYWNNQGITAMDPEERDSTNLLNPTFCYSLAGEGCNVHYSTDPMQPFHLAPLFGNARETVTVENLVRAAQMEFRQWCSTFHSTTASATNPPSACPIIRFFLGEATTVCRSISQFTETGSVKTRIPVAQWTTQTIVLNKGGYGDGPSNAPTVFDVIDTSNLCDHVGLLNILISTIPLLCTTSPSSGVLYTESLLFRGENATKEFAEQLYGDITTVCLLIGVCPVDYVSGFNSRSNTHEILSYKALKKNSGPRQFQQLTTWRKPSFGDAIAGRIAPSSNAILPHSFDPWQLGTFLYDMYHQLFEQEDAMTFFQMNEKNIPRAIESSNMIFYMRESFVLFLKLVRKQLHIPPLQWQQIMDRFFEIRDADTSMPMDAYNENDLGAHLHCTGLYTMPYYRQLPSKNPGLFSKWDSLPLVVRVILSVPRDRLADAFSGPQVGTPLLQCDVAAYGRQNIFNSLHLAFGKVISTGDAKDPRVIIEEDPEGRDGSLPLIVSFIMPTSLLANVPSQEAVKVSFGLRSYAGSFPYTKKLGDTLRIFSADLLDKAHVHVLPEPSLVFKLPSHSPFPSLTTSLLTQVGDFEHMTVGLDEDCELVANLTCRLSVKGDELQQIFADRSTPVSAIQVSPCTMRVTVKNYSQDVVFSFPIIGTQSKARVARTSMYIELVVPPFGPMKPDGMKRGLFPVVGMNGDFTPWNIHRVPLDRLPVIDTKVPQIDKWLFPLAGSQWSAREISLRKSQRHDEDTLMAVKDTLHSIMLHVAGVRATPRRVFALRDKVSQNCDTIFFISDLRYDLTCHSVVCDGYVLPLSERLMRRIPFGKLVQGGDICNIGTYKDETKVWKQLVPAFIERCRSWTHGPDCEYVSSGKIPLTDEFDEVPICGCGKGKNVEGMMKVDLWKDFAPYVTRIAISPLFYVSYLETIGRNPDARRCLVCRAKGIKKCTACKKARYCSEGCQKKDWKNHKKVCKA